MKQPSRAKPAVAQVQLMDLSRAAPLAREVQHVVVQTYFTLGNQIMKRHLQNRAGNVRWGLIAMLLGLPFPIVLLAFLFMGGCQT